MSFITGLEIFRLPRKTGKHQCKRCWRDFNTYRLTAIGNKAQKRCPYCNAVLATVKLPSRGAG